MTYLLTEDHGNNSSHCQIDYPLDTLSSSTQREVAPVMSRPPINRRGLTSLDLLQASESGDLRIIQEAVLVFKVNIDSPNSDGKTGLHLSVENQRYEAVKLFLELKSDISIRNAYGATPLHIASERGDIRISRLLLFNGADVNAQDLRGATPLHKAAAGGYVYLCKVNGIEDTYEVMMIYRSCWMLELLLVLSMDSNVVHYTPLLLIVN